MKCKRCGRVHTGPAFDEKVAIDNAAAEIARQMDQQVLNNLLAGAENNSGDGGYGIGTRDKYEAFVKKRNYQWTTSQDDKSSDNS